MASEPKDIIRIDNIKLLKVISDPTRKKIIEVLYDIPLTAAEIADKISYPKDKIYYHIKKLQSNGILIIAESEKIKGITQNKFINAAKKFEIDPTLIGEETPKHLKGEDEVDAKKKELVGNYANAGQEWQKEKDPIEVEAYDFIDKELGKVTPYGTYDVTNNSGWVNVGTDSDTAQFAVRSIQRWWEELGEQMYPESREILIMADGGGSNGSRNRLWKKSLQEWANKEDLKIMVCHFPPRH